MSLINIKNLSSPLSNKVHLMAILLVVFLFWAYRLSGGTIMLKSSTDTGGQAIQQSELDRGGHSSAASEPVRSRVLERRERSQQESRPLEELLREDANRGTVTRERQQDQGGLSDIEKKLGLK